MSLICCRFSSHSESHICRGSPVSNTKSYQTLKRFIFLILGPTGISQRIVWLMWGCTGRSIFCGFGRNTCTDQGISTHYTTVSLFTQNLKILLIWEKRKSLFPFLLDNTAGIVTKRSGFRRRLQEIYFLPVVIEDNGYPPKSGTGTLTIRVCGCESDGSLLTCSAEAIFLPVGLSTGALIAILLCIVILLGEDLLFPAVETRFT